MIFAHKIALDPTPSQRVYFAKACGIARFAWNWALTEWTRQYEAGERPVEASLRRELNRIKRDQFPWMLDVSKAAPQQAIKNLGTAYSRFFAGMAKHPRFKKKGRHDSFRGDNGPDTFEVRGRRIRLPVVGWIKLREELRFPGRMKSATISRKADRWFVSILIEVEHVQPVRENQGTVGVDLGISTLATLSDGSALPGPKALSQGLRRLRRLSRAVSRKVKGSKNRRKAARRLARHHARVSSIRLDALHKLTTDLVRRFDVIAIEDLNVRGLMGNRRVARGIADCSFFEFRRQLEYKAKIHGARIVLIDQWYPSSKTCSKCQERVADLPLSARRWTCPSCHAEHDRDVNAAINLEMQATASSVGSHACGDWSSTDLVERPG